MADLSDLGGTPQPNNAPPAPPSGGGADLSDLGGPSTGGGADLSDLGSGGDSSWSLSNLVHSYLQNVNRRNPNGILQGMDQRIRDAGVGAARNLDRQFLTVARASRAFDKTLGIGPAQHPLDPIIAKAEDYLNKSAPTGYEQGGAQGIGDDVTSLLEYAKLHQLVSGAGIGQIVEDWAPVTKALKNSPNAAKVILNMIEHGITGGTQATLQGGDLSEIGKQAAVAAGSAGLLDAPQAAMEARGDLAERVAPTTRDLGGGPFTQLANEFKGPEGQPMASESAQRATSYADEPGLQYQREAVNKQLHINLAKMGVENALNDANEAAKTSTVAPAIQRTAQGWRYIPPDGSTSMTADETRATMKELRDRWLENEWSPDQEQQIKEAYNDMQDQLARHDALNSQPPPAGAQGPTGPDTGYQVKAQPFEQHDIKSIVDNTDDYGDAAAHLRQIASQQFSQIAPELRQQYVALDAKRAQLQDDFKAAQDDNEPNKREEIMRHLDDANQQLEDLFTKAGETMGSPEAVKTPFKLLRLSNGFDKLQNMMDRHFTFTTDTASDINRPRVAKGLSSLTQHVEQVKSQYGDVLNPVIGDQGLNHIIEMGDLLKREGGTGKAAPTTLSGNMKQILREHFSGRAGLAGATEGGALLYLSHLAGHLVGGPLTALGVLGGAAKYRMMRRALATDPAFAADAMSKARELMHPDVKVGRMPRMGPGAIVGGTVSGTSSNQEAQ